MESGTFDGLGARPGALDAAARGGRFARAMAWLRRFVRPDVPPGWAPLHVDSAGFACAGVEAGWDEILAIDAFEQELLGFDGLWLRITTPHGDVAACELQPGFPEFTAALADRFPATAGWEARVAGRALAGEGVRLFHRA